VAVVSGERVAVVSGERDAVDGATDAGVREAADGRFVVTTPARDVSGVASRHGDAVWVSVEGEVFEFLVGPAARRGRGAAHGHEALAAPMPATVVRVAVKVGDAVRAGDLLIALEAMKMELPIRAPHDGVVAAIHCSEGDLVQPGVELVEVGGRSPSPGPPDV
jgi:biotin carboxyl carrier protein